jgi:ATP-dependent protease ClpP protease subunit
MNVLNLHGVVGVHINAKDVAEQLSGMTGDVYADMNSGGGSITDGVAIMNSIRNYDKGRVIARISYAGSMMTQIAMACDERQVSPDSIFFIHNAQGVAMGDHREMGRRGKVLESMSAMLSKIYAKKTGKSSEEIRRMMDEDTYLFGQEIIDKGFASTMLHADEDNDQALTKDEAVAMMQELMGDADTAARTEKLSAVQLEDQFRMCVGGCGLTNDEDEPTAGPTAFKDFPMVDRPWDGAAAKKRVQEHVGATESPNERYREAFFWYNSAEPDTFESYKLPFVDVVDGKLVAVWSGVKAANGAMAGARSPVQIPQADRARVQAHIDRYKSKWEGQQGGSENDLNDNSMEEPNMDLETLRAEHPDVYQAIVDENAETMRAEARADAEKSMKSIAAMAFEHGVSKDVALKMLEATDEGAAALIALKAQETNAGESQGEDMGGEDDDEAVQKKAASEYAVNFAKTLKIN